MQLKNDEMVAKIESLQSDLAASNHNREKLQNELSDIQTKFESQRDELDLLECSKMKLNCEIEVLKAVLVEAESKIEHLNITEQNLETSRQKEIHLEHEVSKLHKTIQASPFVCFV
jgi:chromosome segregation ATPase